MKFDTTSYRRSWPKGLVTFPSATRNDQLPPEARDFLASIGLPRGRQPLWDFDGSLSYVPGGIRFGTHGVMPLMIARDGEVHRLTPDGRTYFNSSIVGFAACLTVRKRAFRLSSGLENIADLKRALISADRTCLAADAFWASYLLECEQEQDEISS